MALWIQTLGPPDFSVLVTSVPDMGTPTAWIISREQKRMFQKSSELGLGEEESQVMQEKA